MELRSPWDGAILGIARPIEKHLEILLRHTQQIYHSIINNGMYQKGSFNPQ